MQHLAFLGCRSCVCLPLAHRVRYSTLPSRTKITASQLARILGGLEMAVASVPLHTDEFYHN